MKGNKTEHNKINGFQTKKKVMFLSFLLCAKLHLSGTASTGK